MNTEERYEPPQDRTGYGVNEYGTPVSIHTCLTCGTEFTICPAHEYAWGFGGCQMLPCASYDIRRDVDRVWDDLQSAGHVTRESPKPPKDIVP